MTPRERAVEIINSVPKDGSLTFESGLRMLEDLITEALEQSAVSDDLEDMEPTFAAMEYAQTVFGPIPRDKTSWINGDGLKHSILPYQVCEAIEEAFLAGHKKALASRPTAPAENNIENLYSAVSDEEIEKAAREWVRESNECCVSDTYADHEDTYKSGARWMRDKMTGKGE